MNNIIRRDETSHRRDSISQDMVGSDDHLGTVEVSLDGLRSQESVEFTEALKSTQVSDSISYNYY